MSKQGPVRASGQDYGGLDEIEFPPAMNPPELIGAGRDLIDAARERFIQSSGTSSGRSVCQSFSRFHDHLIEALFTHVTRRWEESNRGNLGMRCVIALGGYGRRELSLRSDVDLLFLIAGKQPEMEYFVKEMLHVLFDWKLDVGYSVRRIEDCLETIGVDVVSATAMMESRCIAGSRTLFKQFQKTFFTALRKGGRRWFLNAKIDGWNERHAKYDESVYLLEPNLKESAGGLRDVHTVRWMLHVIEGGGELAALDHRGILAAADLRRLRAAEEFIIRLRNELHILMPRKNDVLNYDAQVKLSRRLGYERTETALAEEVMMREYYRRARDIARLTSRAFFILMRGEKGVVGTLIGTLKRKKIDRQYVAVGDVIYLQDQYQNYLKEDPRRIMALFARARKMRLRVSPRTCDLIAKIVPNLDAEYRRDPKNRKQFMEILKGSEQVARTLGDMHDCGLLAAYLPEFERVHCMVRMDYYHRYTVDEHLIKTVEMFEVLLTRAPDYLAHAAEIARKITRPDILNLALLLHDIGKGYGRGHALRGGQIIPEIGHRIDLDHEDIETLRFLVLAHLKFNHVSQRRDLEDPEVARQMAAEIGSKDRLDLLYIHSICDLMGVSPEAMTEWKAQLYEMAYRVTLHALEGKKAISHPLLVHRDVMSDRVLECIGFQSGKRPESHDTLDKLKERLNVFLHDVPTRYLQSARVEQIAEHFEMIGRLNDKTRVLWNLHPGPSISELSVCSVDRPGSFAMTCGALTAKGVNIWSAQIFSSLSGHAINLFQLTGPENRPLPEGFRLERLRADLNKVYLEKITIQELIEKYGMHKTLKLRVRTHRPSEVRVDNEGSGAYSILEVRTPDRPGLLFVIATVLNEHRLNLHRALVQTEAYGVIDVFYVTDLEYNKLYDESLIEKLIEDLKDALDAPARFSSLLGGRDHELSA